MNLDQRRSARSALAVCVLGLGLAASVAPASAQWYLAGPWAYAAPYGLAEVPLSPRAAFAGAARQGFRPLTRPRFTGATYVLEAVNPRGDQVRLVIDAYDGRILDRARLAAIVPPRGIAPGPFLVPPAPIPTSREASPRRKATARLEPSKPVRAPKVGDTAPASPAAPVPAVWSEAPAPPAAPVPTAAVPAQVLPDPAEAQPVSPAPVAPAPPAQPPSAATTSAPEPAAPPQRSVRVIDGVAAVPSASAGAKGPAQAGPWADPPATAATE